MKFILDFFARNKTYRTFDKYLALSICFSLALLVLSLLVNFHAGQYALEEASNPVTDVILSNLPVYDVSVAFIYGPVLFWALVVGLCVSNPHRIPLVLKSVVMVMLIRSLFISLTHIGPFPERMSVEFSYFTSFTTFGSDLFFSGHTAYPFLMALLFWKKKYLRVLFIVFSLFFAVVVLLGHVHYTIDVLGAYFITHSIHLLSRKFFAKDWERFEAV